MYIQTSEKERRDAEDYLIHGQGDFAATYMTVASLQFLIGREIECVTETTVAALFSVLAGTVHGRQRQAYFLYKKAADALGSVISRTNDPVLAQKALQALNQIVSAHSGKPFKAAAEALGSLPLIIRGPCLPDLPDPSSIAEISWQGLLQAAGIPETARLPSWKGRNLVIQPPNDAPLLVVKLTGSIQDCPLLERESTWQAYLSDPIRQWDDPDGFGVPVPIRVDKGYVFKLRQIPAIPPECLSGPPYYGIAFLAPAKYFSYPNEHHPNPLPPDRFLDIMGRSAGTLGRLCASGIVHTAPIPLFHNRVQRQRRTDQGVYEWHRGGRLDQWLDSCRYPNIGRTGIRDFEHLVSFADSPRKLYGHIGTHLFSLLLVIGSYFRNLEPDRRGVDGNGNPVDARDLFDPDLAERTVESVFIQYYEGFTGKAFSGDLPAASRKLVLRMIAEMGVDHHMEEVLRVADQKSMTKTEFASFLNSRGLGAEEIKRMQQGARDIAILTGPHLGGFNQRISLPELIDFTAAAAARCVADRYFMIYKS